MHKKMQCQDKTTDYKENSPGSIPNIKSTNEYDMIISSKMETIKKLADFKRSEFKQSKQLKKRIFELHHGERMGLKEDSQKMLSDDNKPIQHKIKKILTRYENEIKLKYVSVEEYKKSPKKEVIKEFYVKGNWRKTLYKKYILKYDDEKKSRVVKTEFISKNDKIVGHVDFVDAEDVDKEIKLFFEQL